MLAYRNKVRREAGKLLGWGNVGGDVDEAMRNHQELHLRAALIFDARGLRRTADYYYACMHCEADVEAVAKKMSVPGDEVTPEAVRRGKDRALEVLLKTLRGETEKNLVSLEKERIERRKRCDGEKKGLRDE